MNIKTVTTVDGVNSVNFGNTPDFFYWIKNIGTTTVYVSTDPNITAGGDGVAELTAGSMVMLENYDSCIYVLGAGRVEIHENKSAVCPFRNAPVSSGGGVTNVKLELSDPYNLCSNIKNTTNYNGGGYNSSGQISNTFEIYQSISSYNMTHSRAIDFTNVKKIIIHGTTKSNLSNLTTTAYCHISAETLAEIADDWTVLNQSVGTDLSEFSVEIDCTNITGENYIYFAILHGSEDSGYTSYMFLYDIEFIYG